MGWEEFRRKEKALVLKRRLEWLATIDQRPIQPAARAAGMHRETLMRILESTGYEWRSKPPPPTIDDVRKGMTQAQRDYMDRAITGGLKPVYAAEEAMRNVA